MYVYTSPNSEIGIIVYTELVPKRTLNINSFCLNVVLTHQVRSYSENSDHRGFPIWNVPGTRPFYDLRLPFFVLNAKCTEVGGRYFLLILVECGPLGITNRFKCERNRLPWEINLNLMKQNKF